jgi:hypothetical protein
MPVVSVPLSASVQPPGNKRCKKKGIMENVHVTYSASRDPVRP